jgi:hypothetical protein
MDEITERLESIRRSIEDENVSYGEIAELQSLAEHIDPSDVVLREWAGIPEFEDETLCVYESSEPGTLLCNKPMGHDGDHNTESYIK